MNNPIISIVTIVLNDPVGLRRTLDSIRKQIFSDYELIIVDGESRDETLSVINNNKDLITKWISEKDKGIYDAMRKGLAMTKGEIVHFLNAGDYYLSEKLLGKVEQIFKDRNLDLIWGDVLMYNNVHLYATIRSGNIYWPYFLFKGIPQQAFFYRKSVFNKYNLEFNQDYKITADFDLLLSLLWTHKIKYRYVNWLVVFFETGGASSKVKDLYDERQMILKRYFPGIILKMLQNKLFFSIFTRNELKKVDGFTERTISKLLGMILRK